MSLPVIFSRRNDPRQNDPRRNERDKTTRDKMTRDEMTGDDITRSPFAFAAMVCITKKPSQSNNFQCNVFHFMMKKTILSSTFVAAI
jgi:hypothetical protein